VRARRVLYHCRLRLVSISVVLTRSFGYATGMKTDFLRPSFLLASCTGLVLPALGGAVDM